MRRILLSIGIGLLTLTLSLRSQQQIDRDGPAGEVESAAGPNSGRTMSLAERLWRANYNPDRLPPELRGERHDLSGASTSLAKSSLSSTVPLDEYWTNILPTETDDDVFALAADGTHIYAGGAFTSFVGVAANRIAHWNGTEWLPLIEGSENGVNGFVFAIAVSGSKVYVGGQFSRAGNVQANNIAVWDKVTKSWSALGDGLTGNGIDIPFVSAIEIDGEDIYVGGQFSKAGGVTANYVARWDGSWSSVGSGTNGIVNALAVFDGDLYVGGSFSGAGSVTSNGIALWNGTDWETLAGGVIGTVNEIKVSGDTSVVVGGDFTVLTGEGSTARNLAWWSGSWINRGGDDPFGGPGQLITVEGEVRSIIIDGRDMWVGGIFDDAFPREAGAGVGPLNNVVLFNDQPATWIRLPDGVNGEVNALAKIGTRLWAAGSFSQTGSKEANKIAQWDTLQRRWIGVEPPAALAPIRALALHDGTLYAAGTFQDEKPGLFNAVNHLAHLSQSGWNLIRGDIKGNIYSLLSTPNELIIGGSFITSDDQITVNVARWNAAAEEWHSLTPGSGVAGLDDVSFVTAMLADGDNVYVGGQFGIADTMIARNIAIWNRQTEEWRALGEGFDAKVWALAIDPQGTLYAGGEFMHSGDRSINGVARWDGSSWQPLGGGVEGSVRALIFAEGQLWVGGNFRKAGGVDAVNIARWDPVSGNWSNLGSGLDSDFQPVVSAFAYNNGAVFAAGKFEVSGLDSMYNIARWNDNGWWVSLGSGTDRSVQALAVDAERNRLYVGGEFLLAGTKNSPYTALWRDPTLSVDFENSPVAGGMISHSRPNPFRSTATVRILIPDGSSRRVSLSLCDPTGRRVSDLKDGTFPTGEHEIRIDGEDLPAGLYFLRLESEGRIESIPLIKE